MSVSCMYHELVKPGPLWIFFIIRFNYEYGGGIRAPVYGVSMETRVVMYSAAGVTGGCELPDPGGWELNSGPLKQQSVFLTTELFLRPLW